MDAEFIRELFALFGPVTVRRMFHSAGIFADGMMFGLINDDTIYLKVDDSSIPDFEREGSRPFSYTRSKRGSVVLPYWRLPERLYDDPEELAVWARRAFDIAQHKKVARMPRAKHKRRRASLTKNSADRRRYRA